MVCEPARHADRSLILMLSVLATLLPLPGGAGGRAAAQSAPSQAAALAAQLGSDDRKVMQDAIVALGATQAKEALPMLEALEAGTLRVTADGHALIRKSDGTLRDAFGGAAVPAASAGKLVEPQVTNTVRRVLKNALSTQRLRAPDVKVRKLAAEVLAESPTSDAAAALRTAAAKEPDAEVRDLMALALAQLDLTSPDAKKRLGAVNTLARVGEPSHAQLLSPLVERAEGGSYLEKDAAVREAALATLSSFERTAFFFRVLRDVMYGLSLGSVLLLAALGLAITFGVMGVINMAHGEMLMLGAYSAYVAQQLCQRYAPSFSDSYLLLALPLAFVTCLLTGVLIERVVIRHLYGRPLETLLATWGISLCLIQTVRIVFGAQNVTVANPPLLSGGVTLMPDVVLPYARVATIVFASAIVLMVFFVLAKTSVGLQVRAITQNRRMARCVGIRTSRVDMLTFGLGSAVAGLGGVALSQLGNVGPELGQGYIVDSFMVVVVGGVGNVLGTVLSAVGLGVVNKLLEPLAGAVLGKIILLGFIILFIQSRPQGLFALKGRAAES